MSHDPVIYYSDIDDPFIEIDIEISLLTKSGPQEGIYN
jgi:hypothetical protein